MALKPVIDSLDQVPEGLREHYTRGEGDHAERFVLSLDGAPAGFRTQAEYGEQVNRVAEFRNNNITLTEENKKLKETEDRLKAFGDITPDTAKDALAKVKELGDKGVKKGDDIQALITQGIQAAVNPLKEALDGEKSARERAEQKVRQATLRTAIGAEFAKAGGEPSALDFIISRAVERNLFEVDENGETVKAKSNVFSEDNPGSPLTPSEWMRKQTKESPFAFKSSKGTDVPPNSSGNSGGVPSNVKKLVNPTPQELGRHMDAIRRGEMIVVDAE